MVTITDIPFSSLQQPHDSAASVEVLTAYDRELLMRLPLCDWQEADAMIQQAKVIFADRSQWIPIHERAEILLKIAARVEEEADAYATLIAREGGKPISMARVEVERAAQGIRYAASHAGDALSGEEIPNSLTKTAQRKRMSCLREPIGVVVAISAFNHPLNLIVHQVIPAIAVGCPVIVKPSLDAPLACLKLMETIRDAGIPEHWCRAIICDNNVAEKLATDPRIAFLSFIGSADVGWKLRSKLSPGVRCAMEHGGNAPVIILPYANQDEAIPTLLNGGMAHAGQVCVSVQRVYVPWAEGGHFARKLGEAAERLVVGDPTHEETVVGPLIDPKQLERVHHWVNEAIASGAKLMSGGQAVSETVYQPTILFDPPDNATVTTHEIFGPVICVYGYDDLDDAIKRANDSRFHFQAAIWGRQYDDIEYTIEHLNAATVMVNDATTFRVDWMPFGGRGASGLGVGGIPYTMHDYTQHKLIVR